MFLEVVVGKNDFFVLTRVMIPAIRVTAIMIFERIGYLTKCSINLFMGFDSNWM